VATTTSTTTTATDDATAPVLPPLLLDLYSACKRCDGTEPS